MVYMPKLRSGKIAPLPWQITLFYKVGITWPLEDNASTLTKVIDYFKSSFVLVLYLYFGLSQFAFICLHTDNVGEMVACVAYFLNCTEVLLRTIALVLKKFSFKDILDKFYANIYLERVESVELKRYMDRHIWPTRMSSYFMLLTLICFWAMPIYSISKGLTTLPFPVVFLYDYTQLHWYIITSLQMCLMASIIGAHLIAESNMIATFVSHLNGRYIILQEDIRQLFTDKSLQKSDNVNVSQTFHQHLKRFYRQNEELNIFCQQIQKLYSLTFFIIFLNNVFLLCILSFKIATAKDVSGAVSYIFWLLSKVIDLVIIGKLGAALEDTTNNMSYIYYSCNWELVIMKKSSCEDNLKLLKFIRMAITLNQKPITLNGGNFFNVNLELVLSILKGAGSYFAFLYNFRE